MPIYEYQCSDCEEEFEIMCSMSERDESPECPKCGGTSTERQMSSFAVGSASSMDASKYPGPPQTTGSCPTGTCSLP